MTHPELTSKLEFLREAGLQIFKDAMDVCSVANAFAAKVVAEHDVLKLVGAESIDLSGIKRILVIAIGKGAASMLRAFLDQRSIVEGREVFGVLVAPASLENLPDGISYFSGGHPFPNKASFDAAHAALDLLASCAMDSMAAETFCFFLVSGGGSAMFELPLDASISLDDTIQFHRALVHSGASITEINCVRKHFSAVKGGRLALAAGALRHLTFAISDVPAGLLDALSSGPTLPDSSTVAQCQAILEKYALIPQFSESVRRFFKSSRFAETPKSSEISAHIFSLLSSDDLAAAACKAAEKLGFKTVVDNTCDDWDYATAADYLLNRLFALQPQHGRVCLISAGEVTVHVPTSVANERRGKGGRNQHFALYGALRLRSSEFIAILSAGSDGVDGNSPAAGAVVDVATVLGHSLEAQKALNEFDSFSFLNAVGSTLITGPTGNNLRDLRVLLADK